MMLIHGGDPVNHRAPAGWAFVHEEPVYLMRLDAELYCLEQVS